MRLCCYDCYWLCDLAYFERRLLSLRYDLTSFFKIAPSTIMRPTITNPTIPHNG
jgi:hypothetical protein